MKLSKAEYAILEYVRLKPNCDIDEIEKSVKLPFFARIFRSHYSIILSLEDRYLLFGKIGYDHTKECNKMVIITPEGIIALNENESLFYDKNTRTRL
jgi:hypothetical protein